MRTLETEFKGLSLKVEYDYEAADPMTRDYPGAEAIVTIERVWVEIPQDLSDMFTQELEELCWEDINEMLRGKAEALAQDYLEDKEERWKHKSSVED